MKWKASVYEGINAGFVLQEDLQKSNHLMNWSANLQFYRDVREPDKWLKMRL